MKKISPSIFKLIRNTGLVLLALWLAVWAYLYFTHSPLLWEKKKVYVPITTIKNFDNNNKLQESNKGTTASKPKETPFYQPIAFEVGHLDPQNMEAWYEIDGFEGVVEKIEGRVVTIKLDHERVDESGKIIKPGTSGYDTAFQSVRVEIPEGFNNIFVQANASKWDPVYINFEDIQIGQRVGVTWGRSVGSQEPFKLNHISISP